jgi:hypothetical protein
MEQWIFPLGLLGTVVLVSISPVAGGLLALVWGFVLVPHVAKYIHTHSRAHGDTGGADDVDTHYWRTTLP